MIIAKAPYAISDVLPLSQLATKPLRGSLILRLDLHWHIGSYFDIII